MPKVICDFCLKPVKPGEVTEKIGPYLFHSPTCASEWHRMRQQADRLTWRHPEKEKE